MDRHKQLPAEEISEGKKIASVYIHVERTIGRMKSFSILKHTIPITLAGISNQSLCMCSVLVPPHESTMDQDDDSNSDVDEYLAELNDEEQELSDLGDSRAVKLNRLTD